MKKWFIICGVIIVMGLVLKPYINQQSAKQVMITSPKHFVKKIPPKITIHIAGEVVNPGVYEVPANWTTLDLIQAIKIRPNANLDQLKLAAPLKPNSRILIKAKKSNEKKSKKRRKRSNKKDRLMKKVMINEATASELEGIPGIGHVMARRIITYRNQNGRFINLTDLLKVKGIGKKTITKIKQYIQL